MQCPEQLRLQAYFDGELGVLEVLALEEHVPQCPECGRQRSEWEHLRAELRKDGPGSQAPVSLRSRIEHALDLELQLSGAARPSRPRVSRPMLFSGLFGAALGAALAGAVTVLWFASGSSSVLLDALVSSHVRALMPGHLIDIESSDRHTVKPWFAGRAEVSPAVADFATQGYRLVGGRLDFIEHRRAAVLVYQHGPHTINVFSWQHAGAALPAHAQRGGYGVDCWQAHALQYCAVSDMGQSEQQQLVQLLRALP